MIVSQARQPRTQLGDHRIEMIKHAIGKLLLSHIDLELHEFSYEIWSPVQLSFSVAILNQDVFPLDITEISQSPECFDIRSRMLSSPLPDTYPIRRTFVGCCASANPPAMIRSCTVSQTTFLLIVVPSSTAMGMAQKKPMKITFWR